LKIAAKLREDKCRSHGREHHEHLDETWTLVGCVRAGPGDRRAGVRPAEIAYDMIKERGVLKVGVKFDYPPLGSLDKDGKPFGWGIDMATAVAYAKQNPALETGVDWAREAFTAMVPQNDSKWRNFLNHTFQEMWHNGSFQKIWEKHWGYPPDFKLWSEFGLQPGIGQN
jgi:ABC-type amino acid transport substrate-binding protein